MFYNITIATKTPKGDYVQRIGMYSNISADTNEELLKKYLLNVIKEQESSHMTRPCIYDAEKESNGLCEVVIVPNPQPNYTDLHFGYLTDTHSNKEIEDFLNQEETKKDEPIDDKLYEVGVSYYANRLRERLSKMTAEEKLNLWKKLSPLLSCGPIITK